MTTETNPSTAAKAKSSKRPNKALMAALPVALIVGGAYMWLSAGRFESTENAAVQQARISVAPQLSGRVTEVFVGDNQMVEKGAPLFRIDPESYKFALAQADAALAQAQIGVEQLRAAHRLAETQVTLARDEAAYLKTEFTRQTNLTQRGAASDSSLDKARYASAAADEALAAAQQGVQAALAALGGDADIKTENHPTVRAAQVARDQAAWQLDQTLVRAPTDGLVYQASSFKPGQFASTGSSAFTLVETADTWIEANFKETQLTNIEIGQTAEVEFDIFPDRHFDAVVDAIGAGTGAEFSLLPAQNATGNWVKVTQRVPVRLRLIDGAATAGLRTGLSAHVTVDTTHDSKLGALIAKAE
jgi:membrane fusion protein (multidrug efflux system)